MNYWKEAFIAALEEIEATIPDDEKLELATKVLEGAHDSYGMVHGHDCIPNPLESENDALRKELKKERSKEHCRECDGTGRIITYGGTMQCDTQCWKCRGEGKIAA